ncbi:dihydroneopterin triphosphate diphosphatase [Neisseriaceae bacterium B1]
MLPENPKLPKKPVSVLVLLHDNQGNVLLLERADKADFWQSVTGSLEHDESPFQAALREVAEETGLQLLPENLRDWHYSLEYEIYPYWRHRYAAGVTHNREHWFSAEIAAGTQIQLAEGEHVAQQWLPAKLAAEKVFSPSNREIIEAWVVENAS